MRWPEALGLAAQPGDDAVRSAAREELGRGVYAQPRSLVERVVGWIGEQLADLLGGAFGGGASRVVGTLVLVALLALVALLVLLLVRGRRPRGVSEPPPLDVSITEGRTAGWWRREAERAEREGRHRDAVRARYAALVAELVDREVVDPDAGATAGEHRVELARRAPAASPPFDRASDLFERTWYGGADAGTEEARRVRQLGQQVLDEVAR